VGEQITLLKPHQVPLMHHMSHLFNAVMFTAPAPAGGRAINTAQATYHEIMHHMSHLINAVMPTASASAGGEATNTAQATYQLMHHLSHLHNALRQCHSKVATGLASQTVTKKQPCRTIDGVPSRHTQHT